MFAGQENDAPFSDGRQQPLFNYSLNNPHLLEDTENIQLFGNMPKV
jgi:hypothetical protein